MSSTDRLRLDLVCSQSQGVRWVDGLLLAFAAFLENFSRNDTPKIILPNYMCRPRGEWRTSHLHY